MWRRNQIHIPETVWRLASTLVRNAVSLGIIQGNNNFFPSLFHIALHCVLLINIIKRVSYIKIRHALVPMGLGFKLNRKKYMSCTKISRHRQLNAWRMEITTCTTNFFRQNNIKNGSQRQKIVRTRKS